MLNLITLHPITAFAVLAMLVFVLCLLVAPGRPRRQQFAPISLGFGRVRDVAFLGRMGAGIPGDPNRTHPISIEPCLIDASAPPTAYGQAVLIDPTTQGARPLTSSDTAVTKIYGITVRPYPIQQQAATNYGAVAFGAGTPPTAGVIDVVKDGYIMTGLGGSALATKDGAVYVWIAASSGAHIQGAFEAGATSGSTVAITNARFNGQQDASGVCEIIMGAQA